MLPRETVSLDSLNHIASVSEDEFLNHNRDTTEAAAIGSDEAAEWAYGSDYFLREEYLNSVANQSRNPGKTNKREFDIDGEEINPHSRSQLDYEVKLSVNSSALCPRFFSLGNDFPPFDRNGSENQAASGSTDVSNELLLSLAGSSADMDIIVPVVDPNCAMAQSAVKGSTALVDLKRQMETEKATRNAMDTQKSDLTQLVRKKVTGQLIESNEPSDSIRAEGRKRPIDSLLGDAEDSTEAEIEALKRKIRLEEAKLNPLAQRTENGGVESFDAHNERQKHFTALQKKREKKDHLLSQIKNDSGPRGTSSLTDNESDEFLNQMERRDTIRSVQENLPIYLCRDALLRCIGENPVTIVVGETGSGKTTQLVQYLYQRGYARNGQLIGCTQPRRLAAIGVARRVSEEMQCSLGSIVGYSIHLDDTTTEQTKIKFMTDGVMLREIVRDPEVQKYGVVVLDEAHERSVDTDVLLGILKLAVRRRSDLKLVVTSATMDIEKFSTFFGNAPVFRIAGRTFPVEIRYSPSPIPDYVSEAVFRVCQLHLQMPLEDMQDILVFMTGRDDVYGTCELIKRKLFDIDPSRLSSLILIPCLSEATSSTANFGCDVLEKAPPGHRKCVVATNVAETSLTIDGVRYVIDCGFMKANVFRPRMGMNTLQRYPVSQAQAGQRKGRAGRTVDGLCFRLYTEKQFAEEMLADSVPEIQRSSVDTVVLLLKSIGIRRLVDFDFMDAPPPANIKSSMWRLWVLGLLDDDGAITEKGYQTLEFPISPALATLLVESTKYACSHEAIRIVSMIAADPKNLMELPKGSEEVARQHHSHFYVNDSDHLTLLNILTLFLENGKSKQWTQDHFLHTATLFRACDIMDQLLERMYRLKLPVLRCGKGEGLEKVRYCLAKAFCLQSAHRSGSNWTEYRPLLNPGVVCTIHPGSAVCTRSEMPSYIIYNDLLLTTKEYLVMVTAVEPEWLKEGSNGLFLLKHSKKDSRMPFTTQTQTVLTMSMLNEPTDSDKNKNQDSNANETVLLSDLNEVTEPQKKAPAESVKGIPYKAPLPRSSNYPASATGKEKNKWSSLQKKRQNI